MNKEHPLNFKVSDETAREFQEIMSKLESDNQTETQENIIKLVHKLLKKDGIGKAMAYIGS